MFIETPLLRAGAVARRIESLRIVPTTLTGATAGHVSPAGADADEQESTIFVARLSLLRSQAAQRPREEVRARIILRPRTVLRVRKLPRPRLAARLRGHRS